MPLLERKAEDIDLNRFQIKGGARTRLWIMKKSKNVSEKSKSSCSRCGQFSKPSNAFGCVRAPAFKWIRILFACWKKPRFRNC